MRITRLPATLVCLAAMTSGAAAQLTMRAVSVSPITVQATLGTTATHRIAANSDVTAGYSLAARRARGACDVEATATFAITRIFGGIDARMQNVCLSHGACGNVGQSGRNAVLVTITSPRPVAGRLIITRNLFSGPNTRASSDIDVGNDGAIENLYSGTALDVVVGPAGLPVLLAGHASVIGVPAGLVSNSVAAVLFVPHPRRLLVDGVACGGPQLEGVSTPSAFLLAASGVPAGRFALFAFGTNDPRLALPPANCLLRTDLLAAVGVGVRSGRADLRVPVTVAVPRGTYRMQFLIASAGAWRTSNAVVWRR